MSIRQELIDTLNSMKPGQWFNIDRRVLQDLPPKMVRMPVDPIIGPLSGALVKDKNGWEYLLESVIGSAFTDMWQFDQSPDDGKMICKRLKL